MTRDRTSVPMRPPSAARFLIVALLVPVLLIAGVVWLRTEYRRSEVLRVEAARSFDRRIDQLALLSRLKDAETAQRGFLLTGDPLFLAPYEPARRDVRASLASPAMRQLPPSYRLAVEALVARKFAELDSTILLRRGGDGAAALRIVREGRGRRIMDRLRTLIGQRIATEQRQSGAQLAAFLRYRAWLPRLVYAVVGTLIALLFATLLLLWRIRRERYAALIDALEAGGRASTVLDSTIDAILILNPSGTVERVNAAATRMLGYRSEELERRDIGAVLDLAPGEGSFHARVGLVDGQLRRSFLPDQSVRHRDGHAVAVDVAVGVMRVPSGLHLVVSLRDIAERKRLERIKDELVSTVSHELRTPLTSVVGALGLLGGGAAGTLPPDAARLVSIADTNSRRLIRLINDMLDIDRIESGKLVLERTAFDLRLVLEEACHGSEGLARSAGVTLDCPPTDDAVVVFGDCDRLVQVATNLISNAVRAAPAGSTVTIGIAVDGDRAVLSVDDRGAGVPVAFRDRIFGRFERGAPDDGSIGTGLGLAISREIVVRHGGTIWFEDRPGGGTRFAFALPLAFDPARAGGGAPTVLICAEDDRLAGELAAIVVAEGCAQKRARSDAEARAMLAAAPYAAVLVSLTLPDAGGLAFAQSVRDREPPFAGPIVVVTATAAEDGAGAGGLDVIDWIGKPAEPERLGRALRAALTRSSARVPVVLHLDDDRDLIEVVAAAIEPEARVVAATDLAEARALLQDLSPDVAILDLKLARGSGLDLMPFLVDRHGCAIPTIIYSAQDASPEQARAVDAVLVKARGSIPDLKATIRRVVRARGKDR